MLFQHEFSRNACNFSSVILIRMGIKAIIFDLGGVLLRTQDFIVRERLAERLGMDRHELEEFVFGGDSGDKAQRGEISVTEHFENLRHQLGCSPEGLKNILDEFFSQDSLDESLVDFVRILHKTYKTALLSNAWDDLREVIAKKWHFEDAFDAMIISAEVGMAKPDQRIFQLTLEKLDVAAHEAVFVDDFQRNVDAAKVFGLQAIRFQTPQQVREDIARLIKTL